MDLNKYYLKAMSNDFLLEIAKGNIDGHAVFQDFYALLDADTTERDIWDYGGTVTSYTYTANTGADFYICSDDNNDTQPVLIYFLDQDFDVIICIVVLQGQTPVKINTVGRPQITEVITKYKNKQITASTKCTRIYRAFNFGAADFAGNIYITEGDDITIGVPNDPNNVRAYIPLGTNNTTLLSHYTIPNEWYGMVLSGRGSITNKATVAADTKYFTRLYGKIFRIAETFGTNSQGTGLIEVQNYLPNLIPPKTDIKLRIDASGACAVSGSYLVLLVNQNFAYKIL